MAARVRISWGFWIAGGVALVVVAGVAFLLFGTGDRRGGDIVPLPSAVVSEKAARAARAAAPIEQANVPPEAIIPETAGLMAEPEPISSVTFHPDVRFVTVPFMPGAKTPSPGREKPYDLKSKGRGVAFAAPQLWGDRYEYWADDVTAQFFALLAPTDVQEGQPLLPEGQEIVLSIMARDESKTLFTTTEKARDPRVSFLVDLRKLPVGDYRARAALIAPDPLGGAGTVASQADFDFSKTTKHDPIVRIPEDGIPLVLEKQTMMADGLWPVKLGVPLPRNAAFDAKRLVVIADDGTQVPAEVREVVRWEPNGSLQWVHVDFMGEYKGGKPAQYRLTRLEANEPRWVLEPKLKCGETPERITVETGYVRFTVNRKAFNGIEQAWFDPAGTATYNEGDPVIKAGEGAGAYLVDERNIRFDAAGDPSATVVVDEQGPVKVRITATGWYAHVEAADKRLCKYVTRISAFAGSPMIRIEHQTYITYNTDDKQLADLGFHVPVTNAVSYMLGADAKTLSGNLPDADTVFLHQDRWDRFRFVADGKETPGGKSDGWFSVTRKGGVRVTALLRDVWQKFPKECELGRDGIALHFWPKHGHEAFTEAEELDFTQLYKFLCFHDGELLNLKTPATYVERFDTYAKDKKSNIEGSHQWWRESEHDATRDGNAQGVVISNEFALVFSDDPDKTPTLPDTQPKLAELFQYDPTAQAPPAWNCSTRALGPIAEVDTKRFPEMEEAIDKGFLSWTRSVERGHDYGMFNYADTHTMWNPGENRAYFHRIWQGSHYHNIGTNWINYYRNGSPEWLRWARKNTDLYINIDTTNYVDEENPVPVRDHELGAMQHMGWKTHWASSGAAWGQYKGIMGHFIDPDASLWCWYMTGNPRAKEAYDFWFQSLRKKSRGPWRGFAREYNTTLAYMVSSYWAKHDPTLLPAIYTTAYHLRTRDLHKQKPGPLWHPLWLNRYHDLTRDPVYAELIIKSAREGLGVYPWPTALSCKAIALGGEKELLTRFFLRAERFPLRYFRKEGHPYDWYGAGPGPLGDNYIYMNWGYFVQTARELGIDRIPESHWVGGGYPFTPSRWKHLGTPPSTRLLALEEKDGPFVINLGLRAMGGSLHAVSVHVYNPRGEQIHTIERVGQKPDTNKPITLPADGMTGIYRVDYRSHEAMPPIPQTNQAREVTVMRAGEKYKVTSMAAWCRPLDEKGPFTFRLEAFEIANAVIKDANGKRIDQLSLFKDVGEGEAEMTLDPAQHPAPWLVECAGKSFISFDNDAKTPVVVSASRDNIDALAPHIRQTPALLTAR